MGEKESDTGSVSEVDQKGRYMLQGLRKFRKDNCGIRIGGEIMKRSLSEPFLDSSRVVPKLCEAMSHPARITRLPELGLPLPTYVSPYPLFLLFALLEHKRSFQILDPAYLLGGRESAFRKYIRTNTGAQVVAVEKADILLLYGLNLPVSDRGMDSGETRYTPKPSLMVCHLDKIAHGAFGPGCLNMELANPISGTRTRLGIFGLSDREIEAAAYRSRQSVLIPPRSDLMLCDAYGHIVYLPHSVHMYVAKASSGPLSGTSFFPRMAAVGD